MNLQFYGIRHTIQKLPRTYPRILTHVAIAIAFAAAFTPARAETEGVYVAGKGTSVEQAFNQALADHQGKKQVFWIVVSGPDVARFSKPKANAALFDKLKTVRAKGGVVFVCRSDLNHQRVREEDLVDGVAPVYGYGTQDWAGLLPAKREEVALPEGVQQSSLIIKTCSGNEKGNGL